MKRFWNTWLVFAGFLAVVLLSMGWITREVLRLEQARAEAQRTAQFEGIVRLALWRMDSAASALVVQESARPYYEYSAFHRAGEAVQTINQPVPEDTLVPSPLLGQVDRNINIYFNAELNGQRKSPDGTVDKKAVQSPQIPSADWSGWAKDNVGNEQLFARRESSLQNFRDRVNLDKVKRALETVPEPAAVVPGETATSSPSQSDTGLNDRQGGIREIQAESAEQVAQEQGRHNLDEYDARFKQVARKQSKAEEEKELRYDIQSQLAASAPAARTVVAGPASDQPSGRKTRTETIVKEDVNASADVDEQANMAPAQPASSTRAREGGMRVVWVDDLLVLGRIVDVSGKQYLQGAWLNWDHLRQELLDEIHDLLPEADLVPAPVTGPSDTSRLLASIPARLVTGDIARRVMIVASPLRFPLAIAWTGTLAALLSIGLLLAGIMRLSERRATFVSAVTHELRTPLTTFRLYSEMLAENLITDPDTRTRYLQTLMTESNRLGHLVENVLAYSRLERGVGARVMEPVTVNDLIETARERLTNRAREAGRDLQVDVPKDAADIRLRTDRTAVEQILFNLVDNACKYAVPFGNPAIHLSIAWQQRTVMFRVSDHGPGLARSEVRRVFRPFRKSAKQAACTSPGVGLGLAICKRLARQLGGDIGYEARAGYGACFTVRLPSTPAA